MRTRYGLQTLTMLHAPHLHMQAWGHQEHVSAVNSKREQRKKKSMPSGVMTGASVSRSSLRAVKNFSYQWSGDHI